MRNALATLTVLVFAGLASANITVNGDGKITFAPNIAHVTLTVSSEAATAAEAWQKNADLVKKLFQALKERGIDEKDLKTTSLNVSPKYFYPKDEPPELIGFTATYNLTVTVRKLNELGQVLDGLVANGADRVVDITFTADNLDELMDQARAKAIAAARRKAEIYAKGAGANLGQVVTISEGNNPPHWHYRLEMAKAGNDATSQYASLPIAGGQQDLTVTVSVTYTIKNSHAVK
jgi:uncharacterized protein YggE